MYLRLLTSRKSEFRIQAVVTERLASVVPYVRGDLLWNGHGDIMVIGLLVIEDEASAASPEPRSLSTSGCPTIADLRKFQPTVSGVRRFLLAPTAAQPDQPRRIDPDATFDEPTRLLGQPMRTPLPWRFQFPI